MINQYRKRPVTIDAVEWTGTNHRTMFEFLCARQDSSNEYMTADGKNFYISHGKCTGGLVIKTSEGDMIANIGDFIIKEPFDTKRGFYPCKPDVFNLTYEEIK